MTSSEDRYVKPTEGEDPREIDREFTDAELVAKRQAERAVSHPQESEGDQRLTSDAPGVNVAERQKDGDA
jgi:hypothetical protein